MWSTYITEIKNPRYLIPLTLCLFTMIADEVTTIIALGYEGVVETNPLGFHGWSGLVPLSFCLYATIGYLLLCRFNRRIKNIHLRTYLPYLYAIAAFLPYLCTGILAVINNLVVIQISALVYQGI